MRAAARDSHEVKSFLADLATSEQPGQPTVNPDEVFLYPTGMNAIYTLSQALVSPEYKVAMYG